MHIHGTLESSTVNGPGNRAVIWVQGCHGMNCPECWNKETHPHGAGKDIDVVDVYIWLSNLNNIEGITISGGEPMQQAPSLAYLLSLIRAGRPDLSIGMYSGYSVKELSQGKFVWWDPDCNTFIDGDKALWKRVRDNLDFVVAGRFNKQLRVYDKPMCSSSNQTLELLSSFYKLIDFKPPTVEITISPNGGLISVTGFPTQPNALKEGL